MGHTKRKHQRPAPVRSRTTRSKGKALGDPAENTQLLATQLRALGLYAAHTLGDGNCLFRALSDQLHGSESYHLSLRQDICNWIEAHRQRYEPFVEDERGFDVHLECMRRQATYGGHMELSAFAHMTRRNVKVIQPGLVYVIEWDAGEEQDADDEPTAPSQSTTPTHAEDDLLSNREKRRKRSEKDKLPRPPLPDTADQSAPRPTVYVAYHDWEHFSSIRNLRGPHSGPPNVQETPVPDEDSIPSFPSSKKPLSKPKSREAKPSSKRGQRKAQPAVIVEENTPTLPSTPSQIPLPPSRSPSPAPSIQSPMPYPLPTELSNRGYRSPKRTFDESSASSESSQSAAKRAKGSSRVLSLGNLPTLSGTQVPLNGEDNEREKTPSLLFSGPGSPASSSSLSSVPSPEPSPPPETRPQPTLTQRQRKRSGLPRTAQVASTRASAGRIVIPGGKFKGSRNNNTQKKSRKGEEEEWQKNGTGRLDVRGFRELKI